MAITAENLADQYGLTREDCDKYALQSQTRWGAGRFLFSSSHQAKKNAKRDT